MTLTYYLENWFSKVHPLFIGDVGVPSLMESLDDLKVAIYKVWKTHTFLKQPKILLNVFFFIPEDFIFA